MPGGSGEGDVAVLIGDGESDLYHFGFLNVTFHQNILALLLREVALVHLAASGDDTWEFGVLYREEVTMAITL